MQKFEASHSEQGEQIVDKLIATLNENAERRSGGKAPETDLTEDEGRRLAEALADIADTITEKIGFFRVPVTRSVFLDAYERDIARFIEEGEEQPYRTQIQNAWVSMGDVVTQIFLVVFTNKALAIKAVKKAYPERDVDEDYLNAAMDAVSDKLVVASGLATTISEARGEGGL